MARVKDVIAVTNNLDLIEGVLALGENPEGGRSFDHGTDDGQPGHHTGSPRAERGRAAVLGRDGRHRGDVDATHQVLGDGVAHHRCQPVGVDATDEQTMMGRLRERVEHEHAASVGIPGPVHEVRSRPRSEG